VRLEIRAVTEADLPDVAAVQVASAIVGFAHIFPAAAPKPTVQAMEEEWRRRLFGSSPPDAVGFVAAVDARPVGVAVAGALPDDPRTGQLSRVYVLPDHWAAGIGRQLYDEAMHHLAAQGYRRARLKVLERNQRARQWYERLGWVDTGERDLMYEEFGLVEVIYARDLDADGG
jgi:ribosomal protein S18 acetylase RimI-like enzyme